MNNILILCSGTRVELVKYFKETFKGKGKIICCDNSPYAPTLYEADKGYVVGKITDENYFNQLLNICVDEKIKAVFSLIDPELSLLAKNRQLFENKGIKVIVSEEKTVDLCFDKYATAQHLKNIGLPYIKSYASSQSLKDALINNEISFPIFQKPRTGSCSVGIEKISALNDIKEQPDMLYQQFMNGKEYGVDVFVDWNTKKITDIFIKEKLLMRAGETDKSISVINEQLERYIIKFVESLDFIGQIDIDVFEVDGEFYISEVNPRFGGGYLHAYACGINFPARILNCLNMQENISTTYEKDIVMMKHLTITTIKKGECYE